MSGKKRRLRKVNQLQAVGILLTIAFVIIGYRFYIAPKDLKEIAFQLPDGSKTTKLYVRVADTNALRQKGLMFVKHMPDDQGMLFVYPTEENHTFWMKNTYLSLDMIFMNKSGEVVGILHDVPPLNKISRDIKKPSTYVLELLAGKARELRISEGSTLLIADGLPRTSS